MPLATSIPPSALIDKVFNPCNAEEVDEPTIDDKRLI